MFVLVIYMQIDITRLKSGLDEYIDIDQELKVNQEYLNQAELIDLKDCHVKGTIQKNQCDGYNLNVIVSGIMVLPCSISLKPVDYEFSFEIDDDIEKLMLEIDENYKKVENLLDILPIIWENILMEIPIKVTSSDLEGCKTSGDGWRLVTSEEKKTNPALEKLKDLL